MKRRMSSGGDWRCKVGLCSVVWLCLSTACSEHLPRPDFVEMESAPFTTMATLEIELASNKGPTLIEFAQNFNCVRCDQMTSTMRDLRAQYSSNVRFHRINYLAAQGGNSRFQLGICPTYLFMLDGQVVGAVSGNQPYPTMASKLNDLLAIHQQNAAVRSNNLGKKNEDDRIQESL